MNKDLKKMKNTLKSDTIAILVFAIIFGIIAILNIISLAVHLTKDKSAFEITLKEDDVNNSQEYYLYIDGEEYATIDYNDYALYTFDGKNDYKTAAILEQFQFVCGSLLLSVITILLYRFFLTAMKEQGPFVKQSIITLRIISGLCFALALLPSLVTVIVRFVTYGQAECRIEPQNVFTFIISGVFFMISELFQYGVALQEDSNLIA